jgi:hypothetical protein
MGNSIAPLGVDYTQANALGDQLNLPYFSAIISNDILNNAYINQVSLPFVNFKKRRSMMRTYSGNDQPMVPSWGQRRLKRSIQTSTTDITNSQQDDEVMRGKTKSNKTTSTIQKI